MKNVFTYSLIGLSLSLISSSKNNSPKKKKKNTNESAESAPVEETTPSTPVDGNNDKPINDDNKPNAKEIVDNLFKRKLSGVYALKDKIDGMDFMFQKHTENNVLQCFGKYNDISSIKTTSTSINWISNDELFITSRDFKFKKIKITNEEIIDNEKIITINYTKDFEDNIYKLTDNLKIINNHEEILKNCVF
ncbi:hypothetical protein [Silvanigrella sp.]|jgi:hypothetical protein|uniref:hypothetical protein n=1 Tax=Silvanigrella sp. TaxID=2024976 RepID=UPI0037C91650